MTYRRTRFQTLVFCLALFVLLLSFSASAAEFRRTFLLEVGARYEVSVRIELTSKTHQPLLRFTFTQIRATCVLLSSAGV